MRKSVLDDGVNYSHVNVSFESYKFVKNSFLLELADAIRSFKGVENSELQDGTASIQLAEIVFRYTGIRLKFVFETFGPAVQPPCLDKNNPLVNDNFKLFFTSRDSLDLLNKSKGFLSGDVDMRTGKVSGVFSEFVSDCWMPAAEMTGRGVLSPEELASTLLHEIGHVWSLFYCMATTARTNLALAAIERDYRNERDVEKRRVILRKAADVAELKNLDTDSLANSEDTLVVETVFITNRIKEVRSALGETSKIYDQVNWEYMSDSYARAQGAGPYLSSALAKLYPSWHISKRGFASYAFLEFIKWSSLFVFPVAFVLLTALDSYPDNYDEPGYRLKRIRDQVVNDSKERNVPKESIQETLDTIKVIDEQIAEFTDRKQFLDKFITFIIPELRRAKTQRDEQRALETLLNNDLFIRSNELKLLGGKK